MAIQQLSTEITEQGTAVFTCAFTDEDGAAVVPNADTIVYTLTDDAGTVINSIEQTAKSSAASITIVLTGDDLQLVGDGEANAEKVNRILTVEAEYNSAAGSNLKLKDACRFSIRNLKYVT